MAIVPPGRGREAASEYHSQENLGLHTLVQVKPITGRTHQIRLHMAFINCPVVGDTVYGRKQPSLPLDRIFLHAQRLEITLPGEISPRMFEAPLPDELAEILEHLRQGN
jgi:23S rRNA pseudouridine1911/1915/1917 synthase